MPDTSSRRTRTLETPAPKGRSPVKTVEWRKKLPAPSRELPRAQRDVLLQLADAMNGLGRGFVDQQRLAREAAVGLATVKRAVRWAIGAGFLDRTGRGHRKGDGSAVASTYQLTVPQQLNSSTAQSSTAQYDVSTAQNSHLNGSPNEPPVVPIPETLTRESQDHPSFASLTRGPRNEDDLSGLLIDDYAAALLHDPIITEAAAYVIAGETPGHPPSGSAAARVDAILEQVHQIPFSDDEPSGDPADAVELASVTRMTGVWLLISTDRDEFTTAELAACAGVGATPAQVEAALSILDQSGWMTRIHRALLIAGRQQPAVHAAELDPA